MVTALILLLAGAAHAASISTSVASPYDLVSGTRAYSDDLARVTVFPEALEFEIKWGILTVGRSNLKMEKIVLFDGKPAYHLVSEARSNGFCDAFYKVRDLNESWISAENLSSLGYSKRLREGGFFRDEWVLYDYENKAFVSKRKDKDGSIHLSTGPIPGPVQDLLSSLYYIRPLKLKVGDEVIIDVNTKSNWPLVIRVLRAETIKVPAGKFKTVVVEPGLRKEGIFIQKGKRLRVWLTDDEKHTPVQMSAEIFFGSVSAYLLERK